MDSGLANRFARDRKRTFGRKECASPPSDVVVRIDIGRQLIGEPAGIASRVERLTRDERGDRRAAVAIARRALKPCDQDERSIDADDMRLAVVRSFSSFCQTPAAPRSCGNGSEGRRDRSSRLRT